MNILKTLLHPLWQLLPQKFRRTLFDNVVRFGGEQEVEPFALSTLPQPITIAGYLTAATGLGQAARLAVLALENQGIAVNTFDLTEALFHEKSVEFAKPRMQRGAGTLVLFVNPPVSSLAMRIIGSGLLKHKHRIGAWVWELPHAPPEWAEHAKLFHEFITPSDFALNAIAPVINRPIKKVIHPVAVEEVIGNYPKSPSDLARANAKREAYSSFETPVSQNLHQKVADEGGKLFHIGALMDLGSRYARKNPEGIILAYAKAFGSRSDVILDLKCMRAGAEPIKFAYLTALIATHKLNVNMILDHTSRAEILSWISSLDVMISLHASEGFGLTIAEAMKMQVPCVVTNWSSTTEFCDETCAYPVDYVLKTPKDETGLYDADAEAPLSQKWAQADINHAAKQLLQAFDNRAELSQKGMAAQTRVNTILTARNFCEQLLNAE